MIIDTDKYDITTEDLILLFVPPFWLVDYDTKVAKAVWIQYLRVLGNAVYYFQQYLYNEALRLESFLTPTGQHLSLEEWLNDLYDDVAREIYINENNLPSAGQNWYLESETDPENKVYYLSSEADPAPKIWYLQTEVSSPEHFTVFFPAALWATLDENVVRSKIDPYVVNGYNYGFDTF